MVQNALITMLLTVAFGDATEQTAVVSRAESAPLRVTVTHFQDRTESDEYLWLGESLAEQMRSLLAAAGAEVVDYQHLAAVGQEQVIGETGLPQEHAERSAQVAAPQVAVTGEYRVHDGQIHLVITASRVEPAEPLSKRDATGPIREAGDLLREQVAPLLRDLQHPLGPDALAQVQSLVLPSYEYMHWLHEGKIYFSVGMDPEAWYCFRQAIHQDAESLEPRRLLVRTLRRMGFYDQAVVELEALIRTAPTGVAGIKKELSTLQAELQIPDGRLPRNLLYHSAPEEPPHVSGAVDPPFGGHEWSADRPCGWVREFAPIQVLALQSGQYVAVGHVRFPSEASPASRERVWLAYCTSDDRREWSAPILFPSPINTTGESDLYPILCELRSGEFLLGWVSIRDGAEHTVYVSRSPDLVHWSRAVRTPAAGRFDMAELPDGSVLIASRNTRITRTYDFVHWSLPTLAVPGYSLQMRSVSGASPQVDYWQYATRHPRLIVADDGVIHLFAIVEPGRRLSSGHLDFLLHAASEDGTRWTSSLALSAAQVQADSYGGIVAAAPVPGGGAVLLYPNKRRVPHPKSGTREVTSYDLLVTLDGGTWTRCASFHGTQLSSKERRFAGKAPPWGDFWKDHDGRIHLERLATTHARREILLSDEILTTSGEPIPCADPAIFGDPWKESPESTATCILFDASPGDQETDHIANGFGLLVQRDLQMLSGIQPFMAIGFHSGIALDDVEWREACNQAHIRWADYIVQFGVQSKSDRYVVHGRMIDVRTANIVYDNTIASDGPGLPAAQKEFSQGLTKVLGVGFRTPETAEHFARQLARSPRSFCYVSKLGLNRGIGPEFGQRVLDWAREEPDSPLPYVFHSHLLWDAFSESDLAKRISRDRVEQRGVAQWRPPLNPLAPDCYQGQGITSGIRCEECLRQLPKCLPLRLWTIRAWLNMGIHDRARPHVKYVEENYADDPSALAECARAREYMEDFEGARKTWTQYLASWPGDTTAWPYWYAEAQLDDYDPMTIPARVRLAMAAIRLGDLDDSVGVVREWYEKNASPIQSSPEKALALSFYVYALLESGQPEQAIQAAQSGLHPPDKPDGWVYFHPSTVHFIHALLRVGRRMPGRFYLSALLNQGYWYQAYHRAFVCPPDAVLREELLRMQLHHPLMGS